MPYIPLAHAGRIHYAERGERRPGRASAVFIHGAGGSSTIWGMVLPRVASAGGHGVAIDLPGHGPSSQEGTALDGAAGLTLARYRDAVGELAGALCLGRSVLVGHSLGASVAVEAALTWPDKVQALVLVGAAARLPVHDDVVRLMRDDPEGLAAWLTSEGLSPQAKPAIRNGFFIKTTEALPLEVVRADFGIVNATDLGGRLGDVRCPITWIDGADDRIVPATPGRSGEIVTLRDVGHLIPIEAPGAVAEVVGAATATTGAAASTGGA
jgi:pimeloyl-ACP methyl ester carboxylesterase